MKKVLLTLAALLLLLLLLNHRDGDAHPSTDPLPPAGDESAAAAMDPAPPVVETPEPGAAPPKPEIRNQWRGPARPADEVHWFHRQQFEPEESMAMERAVSSPAGQERLRQVRKEKGFPAMGEEIVRIKREALENLRREAAAAAATPAPPK
jgi:type IV secretory pathway VirB10-like protein